MFLKALVFPLTANMEGHSHSKLRCRQWDLTDGSKATDRLLFHHLQRPAEELGREEVGRNIYMEKAGRKRKARPEFPNTA